MSLPIKLPLKNGFLDKEFRSGYEVSPKLKKIWAVELDLLAEFKRVCDEYGIKYTIFGGTMLGAVRHGGFIPWDDDLDVAMTRDNYNRLCSIGRAAFNYPYFLQTGLSDQEYVLPFARLRNSETTGVVTGMESANYNNGIYIDIYVLEGYCDSHIVWGLQNLLINCTVKPLTMYHRDKPKNKTPKEFICRLFRPFFRLFKYEDLFSLYVRMQCMATNSSSRIGLRHELSDQAKRYWLYKYEIEDLTSINFEGLEVPIVRNYHEVLARIYGNYMAFPPQEERGKWHEGVIHFEPDIPYRTYLAAKQQRLSPNI